MTRSWRLGALGCAGILAIAACSNSGATSSDSGTPGAAGDRGAAGGSGTTGSSGTTGGSGTTGAGPAGSNGAVAGSDGGVAPSDADVTGSDGGAAGAGGSTPNGSPACGRQAAAGDKLGFVIAHTVDVSGLADVYQAGGAFAQTSGAFDFSRRPYGLRLPPGYDPNRSWPVIVETLTCGVDAAAWFAAPLQGNSVPGPPKDAIGIYLVPVKTCLAPGGPTIGNRPDSPDVPYFRAALADAKASACVDDSRVTVSGFGSSAAREAEMLACAAGDVVRALTAYGGGLLAHRPTCKGPVAAMIVAPSNDPASNPLGPVATTDPFFMNTDSEGTIPLRDEILQRNGCTSMASVPWSSAFPACVRFTECPEATPVVWCPTTGSARAPGLGYVPAGWSAFTDMLPRRN